MAQRKRRRYSPEEIERGLTALILAGSSEAASQTCGIQATTLRDWKNTHRDRYDRIARDIEPQVVQRIAAEAENLALRIADREAAILRSMTDSDLAELKPAEKAATLRNLSTSKALQIDKLSSPLRERPSHVQHGNDAATLLASVARKLGIVHTPNHAEIQDSTAIEA
jgi:transposase-like protein